VTAIEAKYHDRDVLIVGFVAAQNGYSAAAVVVEEGGGLRYIDLAESGELIVEKAGVDWPIGTTFSRLQAERAAT
jgi:hypothetical protein